MSTHFKIDYSGWSTDDASPINPDIKIKASHKQLVNHGIQIENQKNAPKYTCEVCGKDNLDYRNYKGYHSDKCQWSHITKEMILDAQSKFDTGVEIWESLNITRKKYIDLCKAFGIEPKFGDLTAIKNASSKINSRQLSVWKYDSTKDEGKGEFIGTFKSISIAAETLEISRVYIDDCIKKRYPTAKPIYIFQKK